MGGVRTLVKEALLHQVRQVSLQLTSGGSRAWYIVSMESNRAKPSTLYQIFSMMFNLRFGRTEQLVIVMKRRSVVGINSSTDNVWSTCANSHRKCLATGMSMWAITHDKQTETTLYNYTLNASLFSTAACWIPLTSSTARPTQRINIGTDKD